MWLESPGAKGTSGFYALEIIAAWSPQSLAGYLSYWKDGITVVREVQDMLP